MAKKKLYPLFVAALALAASSSSASAFTLPSATSTVSASSSAPADALNGLSMSSNPYANGMSEREAEYWGKTPKSDFRGGAGIGRLVLDERASQPDAWKCKYDMVLVERLQNLKGTRGESGLFVPTDEMPKFHLCKVLSVGTGREEENGRVAPMPDVEVGDVVVAKNPWGIGPKDEETGDGKKLSFMRAQDIAAVVTGGLVEEEE